MDTKNFEVFIFIFIMDFHMATMLMKHEHLLKKNDLCLPP